MIISKNDLFPTTIITFRNNLYEAEEINNFGISDIEFEEITKQLKNHRCLYHSEK